MKALHNRVNIVPVIAKADTLTLKERERLKRRVRTANLQFVGIKMQFAFCETILSAVHKCACNGIYTGDSGHCQLCIENLSTT